jgi:type II secretory pathway component PulM
MMENLKQAWLARTARERLYLGAAALFLLSVAFWLGLVEPLRTAGARAEKALPDLRRQAAEMRRLGDEAGRLKSAAGQPATLPGAAALAEMATRLRVPATVTSAGDGRFDVRLEPAPMAGLSEWLGAVRGSHRLFVREARLNAAGEGRVSGTLVLGQ